MDEHKMLGEILTSKDLDSAAKGATRSETDVRSNGKQGPHLRRAISELPLKSADSLNREELADASPGEVAGAITDVLHNNYPHWIEVIQQAGAVHDDGYLEMLHVGVYMIGDALQQNLHRIASLAWANRGLRARPGGAVMTHNERREKLKADGFEYEGSFHICDKPIIEVWVKGGWPYLYDVRAGTFAKFGDEPKVVATESKIPSVSEPVAGYPVIFEEWLDGVPGDQHVAPIPTTITRIGAPPAARS